MTGKVRTREKCPKCSTPFKIIEEIDILCPECQTRPKSFYIFLYHNKEKHRISKDIDGHRLDSYRRAHRLLERIRKDIDDGIFNVCNYLPKEIEQYRGKNIFYRWLKAKEKLAPSTFKEYKRHTDLYFVEFFRDTDMRTVRKKHIEHFLEWLPDKQKEYIEKSKDRKKSRFRCETLSAKTQKNLLIELHNFFSWMYDREEITQIPVMPNISVPDPPLEIILRSDQERILDMMKPHHQKIFSFMIYHPVRPGEARAIKRKDFNLKNMTVHVQRAFSLKKEQHRKNKKDYFLPISSKFDISFLENMLPEAYVFLNEHGRPYKAENLRRIWHRACKKAGIPHIKMYNGCRHSTATDALKRSGNLNLVSKLLGHSSTKITEKYAKADVETLRGLTDGSQTVGAQVVHIRQIEKNN